MASINNDGYGPLMVPGFNSILVDYEVAPRPDLLMVWVIIATQIV